MPALSIFCVSPNRVPAGPAWRRVVEVRAGDRSCGKGSLLDPGGLGGRGEELLCGDLTVALVPAGFLSAGVGMGAPVEVVLSLVIR